MSKARLNIVSPIEAPEAAATVTHLPQSASESRAQKVLRLQQEARELAREQIGELQALMQATADMAHDISEGGDAYCVGAREVARHLAEELSHNLNTLQAILRKA